MKASILTILFILALESFVFAEPNIYYELNFNDNSFGGGEVPVYTGDVFMQPTPPEIVNNSELDGPALEFSTHDQLLWKANGNPSNYHYIAFDFFASSEDSIVVFLDTPFIKRTDISVKGKHKIEIYYDFIEKESVILLDGKEYNGFEVINYWDQSPPTCNLRITHNKSAWMVGESFRIDNLVWKVEAKYSKKSVPLSAIFHLLLNE